MIKVITMQILWPLTSLESIQGIRKCPTYRFEERGGISEDLKSILITVWYVSASDVFVHLPCPSSNLVYRSLESTLRCMIQSLRSYMTTSLVQIEVCLFSVWSRTNNKGVNNMIQTYIPYPQLTRAFNMRWIHYSHRKKWNLSMWPLSENLEKTFSIQMAAIPNHNILYSFFLRFSARPASCNHSHYVILPLPHYWCCERTRLNNQCGLLSMFYIIVT